MDTERGTPASPSPQSSPSKGEEASPSGHVSTSHQIFYDPKTAEAYDREAFAPGTYEGFIWDLQRPVLLRVVEDLVRGRSGLRYLDFACGTGRVLTLIEPLVAETVGLDASPAMAAICRAKTTRAEIRVGDLQEDPEVAGRDYDLITAFRFFLHADPTVRLPVLSALSARLRDADSRLIFNINGNSRSIHGLMSHRSDEVAMSLRSIRELTAASGLEIESWYGFGVCPGSREHLRALRRPMRAIDTWAAGRRLLRSVSRDLLFFCRLAR
jgi:SAM-dependent methyltransferase